MKIQKRKTFFQKMAEIFFAIYLITLYLFVDRNETLIYSKIAFILFCGFAGIYLLQRKHIHIGRNVMTVYIAFTWMFATVFWAVNEYVAWRGMKTIWQLFLLFFMVYNLFCEEENAHEYFLKCLYIAGIVLVGYSINIYSISETIEMMTSSNFRFGKEVNQENTFGMMNATTVIAGFYYVFFKRKYKLFHIAVISGAFLFAMASGSRKALLMICIAVLYMVYKKYGIRQLYKVVGITILCTVLFIAVIQLPAFENIRERMESLSETLSGHSSGKGSADLRFRMIKDGWELFKDRIIQGYGTSNYAVISGYRTYSHNNFVEVLVNFGLVGFVLYYMIYYNILRNLFSAKNDAGKALFCIFMTRFLMEMAMVTYYGKLHWVLMAFFLIKGKENEKQERIGEKTLIEVSVK